MTSMLLVTNVLNRHLLVESVALDTEDAAVPNHAFVDRVGEVGMLTFQILLSSNGFR